MSWCYKSAYVTHRPICFPAKAWIKEQAGAVTLNLSVFVHECIWESDILNLTLTVCMWIFLCRWRVLSMWVVLCAREELMSLYKIRERESTMTVGGSFTLDSGKTFFALLSTSPAVNNWRLLCGERTVHIHHFEDEIFQVLSVLCHIKQTYSMQFTSRMTSSKFLAFEKFAILT